MPATEMQRRVRRLDDHDLLVALLFLVKRADVTREVPITDWECQFAIGCERRWTGRFSWKQRQTARLIVERAHAVLSARAHLDADLRAALG
jgi:hypothetical protein